MPAPENLVRFNYDNSAWPELAKRLTEQGVDLFQMPKLRDALLSWATKIAECAVTNHRLDEEKAANDQNP